MAASSYLESQPETSGKCKQPIEAFPEVCQKVASSISKDWQWLGRNMGFKEPELNNLSRHYHLDGPKEIAYQMLLQWQERMGMAATVSLLAQHLQAVHRVDLSYKVLKMAKESKKRPNIPPMPIIKPSRTHASCVSGAWESVKTMLQIDHSRLEIPKLSWLEEWETGFDDYYVDLTIFTKNEDTKPLHLHEIFDSAIQKTQELPIRILIEGPAGYGKSTLARKFCFDHANKKSYIRHFDAVILLRLREFGGTLEQMIIDTYELENCSAELVSEILTQHQRKVLIILDGLDELHQNQHHYVTPLLKGKRYPQSTVILTSRMGCMKLEGETPDSSVRNLLHCMTRRISIVGVTGENRVTFLQSYLKGYTPEKCASFIKSTDTKFGLSEVMEDNLFDCPLYLLLLVVVAEETDLASLRSRTQLYKHLFNFILRRMLDKEGQVDKMCDFFAFSVENPPSYVKMFFRFGSFAGEALEKRQYTFSEEEILRACGNDETILKLGILTRNDSKIGLRRNSWFEPIHLSFLEFAFAYSIWVGCMSTHPFLRFHHSINMLNLRHLSSLYYYNKLVASFLCGLCLKQLNTLLSGFMFDYTIMAHIMKKLDHEEIMTESQLELSELGEKFLPVVPVEFTVWSLREKLPILLKEALKHAVQTRRDQRITLVKEYFATEQHQGSWLKVTTRLNASEISQDWHQLATSQNIKIADNDIVGVPEISFTLCEAPLQEQLGWLSHFMTIEGVLQNKPILTIRYKCPSKIFPKLIILMTDMIRQERLVGVKLVMKKCEWPSAESWKEFIHCANESKELLDISLDNRADSPLAIDLTPAEGKQWRKVELGRNVAVSVGSQLVDVSKIYKYDLDSLVRGMPSNIQTLEICHFIHIFRNDGLPTAHNVEDLFIRFHISNLSLLQSSVLEPLKNLKVLTIELASHVQMSAHDLATFILSIIFHCHSLVRVEFGEHCTEQLITTFLHRLSKEMWPTFNDQGDSIPTSLHLNTLMIPECVLTNTETANLVKETLQTICIEHLWVKCAEFGDGCATRKFMELFSPAKFNIKVVDKQLWTHCILEVSVN